MKSLVLVAALSAALAAPQYAPQVSVKGPSKPIVDRAWRAAVDERIASLMANLTLLQKAKQINMYFATATFVQLDGQLNKTALDELVNGTGSMGVIHDFYDPAVGGVSLTNALQDYVLKAPGSPGIPIMFVEECLHGVQQAGKTVFPAPVGNAATFNAGLMEDIGAAIGAEARAYGIMQCFAPVIGTMREPRWGRVVEGFGEDVRLTSVMAYSYVYGAQGRAPDGMGLNATNTIIAEPKHYVAHSSPEGGTNTSPVHIGRRELLETFTPQFEWAVAYAGARGIMSAYHELDGIPASANYYTLTTLLRDTWDFRGWVLSDDGAVSMLANTHHITDTTAGAITAFLSAGGNCGYYDYSPDVYESTIVACVQNGTLPQDVLDARVADILRVKVELGLFENPYVNVSLKYSAVDTPAHQQLALQAARESIVLLQNNEVSSVGEGGEPAAAGAPLLPLDLGGRHRTVAVIGPSADVVRLGDYSGGGVAQRFITVLEGIQTAAAAAGANVLYAQGCQIRTTQQGGGVETYPIRHNYLTQTAQAGRSSPALRGSAVAGVLGSYWQGIGKGAGAPDFTRNDWDVNFQWYAYGPTAYINTPINGNAFVNATFYATYTGYLTPPRTVNGATLRVQGGGDPVRLTYNGEVIIDTFSNASNPITVPVMLSAGVPVPFTLEYQRLNGQSLSFQWSLIQNEDVGIANAAAVATSADVAVVVVGEDDSTVGEGIDSHTLQLPGTQLGLVQAIVATGVPTVVVLMHGRPLAVPQVFAAAPAVLSAWFPGQAGGQAVAEVLTGAYNPAGRSPFTWPMDVGQLPAYYNFKPSARHGSYYDGQFQPLVYFGSGLSYTKFNYSNLVLSPAAPARIPVNGTLNISVDITNIGGVDGEEVPQLYVQDMVSSVTTANKQLKLFTRVFIPKGATTTVTFTLDVQRDLYIVDLNYNLVVEPGVFVFAVGPNSNVPIGNAAGLTPPPGTCVVGNFTVV